MKKGRLIVEEKWLNVCREDLYLHVSIFFVCVCLCVWCNIGAILD